MAADAVASSSSQAPNVDENIEENDLELAWEMLELAKKIYESRETSDECNNLLSQTFMTLGEVSMENENFPLAVDDMNKGNYCDAFPSRGQKFRTSIRSIEKKPFFFLQNKSYTFDEAVNTYGIRKRS